jgi:hypothetical protein
VSARFLPASVMERWRSPPEPMRSVSVLHVIDLEGEDARASDSVERLTGKVEPPRALCGGVLEGSLSLAPPEANCPECIAALAAEGFSLLTNPETKEVVGVVNLSTFRAIARAKTDLSRAKITFMKKEHAREDDPRPDPDFD